MADLGQELHRWRGRRLCLVGLGNEGLGDDGLGVRLAEGVRARLRPGAERLRVLVAGTSPERFLGTIAGGCFDEVVFLDAVEFGGAPGAALLLASEEVVARFPQFSTHRLSLGLLARWVEEHGARAWLLGVEPGSLRPGSPPHPQVEGTLAALVPLFASLAGPAEDRVAPHPLAAGAGSEGAHP